jgi:hypothetical protein
VLANSRSEQFPHSGVPASVIRHERGGLLAGAANIVEQDRRLPNRWRGP